MASHRGVAMRGADCEETSSRFVGTITESGGERSRKGIVSSSELQKQQQRQRRARWKTTELGSLCRSSASSSLDGSSLETEGTGISTLTGSSSGGAGGPAKRNYRPQHSSHMNRSLTMISPHYTIYEDELKTLPTRHSSYISRPIDVDSMQEYEDEDGLEPPQMVLEHDDSQSRTTASTYTSKPIDVDSLLEYNPSEFPESRLPEERLEKGSNSKKGFYEGESLLEYSSDDDESSIDFDSDFMFPLCSEFGSPEEKIEQPTVRAVVSVRQLSTNITIPGQLSTNITIPRQLSVKVDTVGPIRSNTEDIALRQGIEDEDSESETELSFLDWEFPILDERDIDRELVGYVKGFEPLLEGLPPRPELGRIKSDAASTKASTKSISTRITFEI